MPYEYHLWATYTTQHLVMNRWKAVCMETCKHGLGRGRQKRAEMYRAGCLLHRKDAEDHRGSPPRALPLDSRSTNLCTQEKRENACFRSAYVVRQTFTGSDSELARGVLRAAIQRTLSWLSTGTRLSHGIESH